MATVDDLFREVITLRREVRKLQRKHQPSNGEMVQELVSDSFVERNGEGQSGRTTGGGAQAQRAKRSCRKPL